MSIRYKLVISWSEDDQAFVVDAPELPGCMADGATYEEAVSNAKRAIGLWMETARSLGRPIPEPEGRTQFVIVPRSAASGNSLECVDPKTWQQIEGRWSYEGRLVPGFIHNGDYFFADLQVYENGIIDCWGPVDLKIFAKKLASGWVRPSVPDGHTLSVHHLGTWVVDRGEWLLDAKGYFNYICSVVKALNPKSRNLYNCHNETTVEIDGIRMSTPRGLGGRPYRREDEDSYFSKKDYGASAHVFIRGATGTYCLSTMTVFADSTVSVSGAESRALNTYDMLKGWIDDGRVVTSPPSGATVQILGLGQFVVSECVYSVAPEDMLAEVHDKISGLSGGSESIIVCQEAYTAYLAQPDDVNKYRLRTAYEAIPRHMRRYVLGDMNSKDWPIRRIIYDDDSHA